jgi:DNA polymerase-3 subunit delta'
VSAATAVRGHERVVERLAAAAREVAERGTDALAHAMIFAGPAGVGKFQVAAWWATRLKCSQPGCGSRCRDCVQIATRVHPDVTVLEPEEDGGSIRIASVRDLIRAMSLRPLRPGPRIAIVRDAHRLTADAQGAMLKLLEEPPGFALLVLVTDNPSALFATLRSRCLMVRFGQLTDADVQAVLEAAGRASEDAAAAAAIAGGSPGRAFTLTAERLADREELIAAYEDLRSGDSADVEKLVVDLVERRKSDRPALAELLDWQMQSIETTLASNGAPGGCATLLEEAARTLWAIQSLERNGNPKLVIRELLLDVRPA